MCQGQVEVHTLCSGKVVDFDSLFSAMEVSRCGGLIGCAASMIPGSLMDTVSGISVRGIDVQTCRVNLGMSQEGFMHRALFVAWFQRRLAV